MSPLRTLQVGRITLFGALFGLLALPGDGSACMVRYFWGNHFPRSVPLTVENSVYTQYKKAPTFAVGCDCSHHQSGKSITLSNRQRMAEEFEQTQAGWDGTVEVGPGPA